MAITYSFVDNAVYGTEDINDITRSLTGAGIAPFVSKDSYNVSDLNAMTSALVEAGASLDGCKCSAENVGTAEMTVTVAQGIVFFESGVRLTVDEDGYALTVTPNTAGYVYAHYSPSLQKADIVFSPELPMDGEYVVLAEIATDGAITDKRTFARSKVATLGKNIILNREFTKLEEPVLYEEEISQSHSAKVYNRYIVSKVSGVDMSKFNYAIVSMNSSYTDTDLVYFPTAAYSTGFLNVETNTLEKVITESSNAPQGYLHILSGLFWYIDVKVIGSELCLVYEIPAEDKSKLSARIYSCTATIM